MRNDRLKVKATRVDTGQVIRGEWGEVRSVIVWARQAALWRLEIQ